MKNIKFYLRTFTNSAFIMLVIVGLTYGCDEYLAPDAYIKNGEAPAPLQSASVTNISGGAKIDVVLPKGYDDLLYVKAIYERNGEIEETTVSRYSNTLYIRGLRDTTKTVNVELIVGNSSGIESTAISVEVKPLLAPVDYALQSIIVDETFGGIRLRWENPTMSGLISKVFSIGVPAEEGEFLAEVFSKESKLQFADYKIRGEAIGGYDEVPTKFGFLFKDEYSNVTDTLFVVRTPIYEQYIEPEMTDLFDFEGQSVHSRTLAASDPTLTWDGPNWGDRAAYKLWDGKWRTNGDCFWGIAHNIPGGPESLLNGKNVFATMDFEVPVKLSRYKLYSMTNKQYVYNEGSPRKFRIWVTPDLTEEEAKNWGPDSNWEVAHDYTVADPLDGKYAHDVTNSDYEIWNQGWEYDLSIDIPYPVRYLRIECYSGWTASIGGGCPAELQIYGSPVE